MCFCFKFCVYVVGFVFLFSKFVFLFSKFVFVFSSFVILFLFCVSVLFLSATVACYYGTHRVNTETMLSE